MKLHYIKIKYVKVLIGISSMLSLFSSCHSRLHDALEAAGENREEMEQVLAYFKNDSDTLKYSAAKFLIEICLTIIHMLVRRWNNIMQLTYVLH